MARRCRWCNRIITEDRNVLSQSTLDYLKKEYGITDPTETSALPMCIDCLNKMGSNSEDDD